MKQRMSLALTFRGSSPVMEAQGAVVLWGQSISPHKLKYRWMVSDGDSKGHSLVENVYGDCKVKKLDCVDRSCPEAYEKTPTQPEG